MASSVVRYLASVKRHAAVLVAGAALGAFGIVANAVGLDVPPFVWILTCAALIVVASFVAWRDLDREIELGKARATAERARVDRLQHDPVIENETFSVFELLRDDRPPFVTNRTFRNCVVKGPAVIAAMHETVLEACGHDAASADEVTYWHTPGQAVGIVGFAFCHFDRCEFKGIGLLYMFGAEADAQPLRDTPRLA